MNENEFNENKAEELIKAEDENFMLGRFLESENNNKIELIPEESD